MPRTPKPVANPLVAFSWGYEGWGNHTRELVQSMDAVEAARGFKPPVFVDVRIRRQVRAVGFREGAFESLLGRDRYLWMRGLGNRAIVEDMDEDISIDRPQDAEMLLNAVLEAQRSKRRVIFFCSCGSPHMAASCHRSEVAELLLKIARKWGVPLAIHEWPGEAPIATSLAFLEKDLKRVRSGQLSYLAVPEGVDLAWAAALPHFSLIQSQYGEHNIVMVSGPAKRRARGWMFPVYNSGPDARSFRRELAYDLKEMNLSPRGARLLLPKAWRFEQPLAARKR